ncbi:MAG: YheC/YheD family protein [bacterium]
MNKKILVIYGKDDWESSTPSIDGVYNVKGYEVFSDLAMENNTQIYRSFYKNIDPDSGRISKVWTFLNGLWQKQEVDFVPDLVIDRISAVDMYATMDFRQRLSQAVKLINDPIFSTLIADKYTQYLLFNEIMKKTNYIKNSEQLLREIVKHDSKIVLKDLSGEGGKGVLILNKQDITQQYARSLKYPLIMQDFLISEKGIPGVDKIPDNQIFVADLRVMTIGNNIMFAVSRVAKKDSLFTNLAKGAVFRKIDNIPKQCLQYVSKITHKLDTFGENILGIDFMFDNHGEAFLIEINSKPGLAANLLIPKQIQVDYLKQLLKNLN